MKTFGHLALFGSFAAAGVALAICVGLSTPVTGKSQKAAPPAATAQARDEAVPVAATPVQSAGLRGDKPDLPRADRTVSAFTEGAASNLSGMVAAASARPTLAPEKASVGGAAQAGEQIGIRVYHTSYIAVSELKMLVAPLLTERTGVVSVSARGEAGFVNSEATGSDKPAKEVLVVRDYETVLLQIDRLVAEVDVRPTQLSIEAIILGVKLRERDNSGVSFPTLSQSPNIRFDLGSPGTSLINANIGGLKFGFLEGNLDTFFDALERIGPTDVIADVIATARLTVLAKPRLRNQVQRGYVGPPAADATATKSIPLLDIGAHLRLQPYVFGDGLIHMEIETGPSDREAAMESGGAAGPHRAITQVITLRDGCTAVIGGVIRQHPDRSDSQLPLLASLPLSGFVYRQTNVTPGREEVLALITPQIVREPAPAVAQSQPASKRPATASASAARRRRPTK
jgi:type II secretory pathway component GspD/PulD (secretin)